MRKLIVVEVTTLAGYHEISWSGIQPDENLLLGRNGAGKSTLLEAIVVGLNYLHGKRSGDLLAGHNPAATIHFEFSDGLSQTMGLGKIRASQTPVDSRPVENVLYVHEGRRPKSRIGKGGRSRLLQHPTRRYEYVLGELQALLGGSQEEHDWAERLLTMAGGLRHSGHPQEWAWARSVLPRGGPKEPRPVSCGQYDVLSLLLDVVRMAEALRESDLTPFVILDNPDAFLHPALQQELIEWIRGQLPTAQFFIASHSLKLLARAKPVTVFWLSRDLTPADGRATVQSVRDLAPDARGLFFELYGDDTSSAVLNLTLGLEASEYLAFRCACALPCRLDVRAKPIEKDTQIRVILDELRHFNRPWTLLDVGAGAGDLLVGAERLGIANPAWEYVAIERKPPEGLVDRVTRLRRAGRIAQSSRIVASLEEALIPFDAIVFANTCHALSLDQLSDWLAMALRGLRPGADSRCIIHEVEVLRHGEQDFVMWTPDDYHAVFALIPGVGVSERKYHRTIGVPVHTTVLVRDTDHVLPLDLTLQIRSGFMKLLLPKLRDLLARLESLKAPDAPPTIRESFRQREHAFVAEQCSNILAVALSLGLIEGFTAQHPSPP